MLDDLLFALRAGVADPFAPVVLLVSFELDKSVFVASVLPEDGLPPLVEGFTVLRLPDVPKALLVLGDDRAAAGAVVDDQAEPAQLLGPADLLVRRFAEQFVQPVWMQEMIFPGRLVGLGQFRRDGDPAEHPRALPRGLDAVKESGVLGPAGHRTLVGPGLAVGSQRFDPGGDLRRVGFEVFVQLVVDGVLDDVAGAGQAVEGAGLTTVELSGDVARGVVVDGPLLLGGGLDASVDQALVVRLLGGWDVSLVDDPFV
ncbi:hypothetical protein [Frankia sp. B2]|uniref:hypothetical protein n=1 Tax=Frankia sp. B2 TaxID=2541730 RepID=UPI00141A83B7